MTQQGPNPLRRYWWLTVVWVPAFIVAIVLATFLDPALFVAEAALVGWFVWFTTGRHAGSERLSVHILFCLFALAIPAAIIFSAFYMFTTDDLPSFPVPTPALPRHQ